jgi:alkaline phosphatase D
MSVVHNLDCGPIIGHTTTESFRIWGRAADAQSKKGAIRWRPTGATSFTDTVFFSLEQKLDGAGVVDILEYLGNALNPATNYEFEVGWVTADASSAVLDWRASGTSTHALRGIAKTFPSKNANFSFLLGSCRDPAELGDKGESTFTSMYETMQEEKKPSFCLMLGDQIYIDHLKPPVDSASNAILLETYLDRYRKAFSLPKFAAFCAQCPSYMILDDHEIQNNWTLQKFIDDANNILTDRKYNIDSLKNGLQAYVAYQDIRNPHWSSTQLVSEAKKLDFARTLIDAKRYYDFECGNAGFFVLDGRGESSVPCSNDGGPGTFEILGKGQMDELKKWLCDDKRQFKFIALGVPLGPDTQGIGGEPNDKWKPAGAQRDEILDFISEKRIERVIFLGGDVHVSYAARIYRVSDGNLIAHVVVSSAFNWVAPGLQWFHFAWGPLFNGTAKPKYLCESLLSKESKIISRNNFARIDVEERAVKVTFCRGIDGVDIEHVRLI